MLYEMLLEAPQASLLLQVSLCSSFRHSRFKSELNLQYQYYAFLCPVAVLKIRSSIDQ
jgi:hypothetical protein